MRQHQVALQELELFVGDMGLRQPAEAGVDAVGRLPARDDAGHRGRAALDGRQAASDNDKRDAAARQIAQGGEIQGIADLEHRAIMPEAR